MDNILKEKNLEVEMLKRKIKDVKQKSLPRCWHGKYCLRLFCKFDHRHVFTKVNIHLPKVKENPNENKIKEYLCDECGNMLKSQHELENHIKTSHEETVENKMMDFKCRECSFVTETRSTLNSHVISNHKDDEIECEICGIFLTTRTELREHREEHKNVQSNEDDDIENLNILLQGLLNENTVSSSDATPHTEKSTLDFKCGVCHESFMTKTSLKTHKKRIHKAYKKVNDQKYEKNSDRSEVYVPISKLKCGLCEVRFVSLDKMDDHMDTQHDGRWKYGDPDVVLEGDDYEEGSSSDDVTSESDESSDTESSESQSGEEG